ncbi:kinase-like domain-containing protein [Aspergillus transmontanensis]|uniref:non-specific serine/threonine protein kinase n=1 Tax=Aspergillus transmontanensis TaxID=1034304 RepID=A0A5N6W8H9_9EURO|nr:kinase-like domain-containing protein [Aspergillus transmontanensis]
MEVFLNRIRGSFPKLRHQPWPLSPATAPRLDAHRRSEEENTPYYDPIRFYPAKLGSVLNGRYQLVTKVGYGTSSTIRLARDLNQWRWLRDKYVAIKINASTHHSRENAAQNELDILKQIDEKNPQHKGWQFTRHLLDSFYVEYGSRKHLALAFEPLREPLWLYRKRFIGDVIPSSVLKIILQMILHGLDYLHSECHIIHTDLKPDNIMVKIEDQSILEESAKDEYEDPLPQKICPDGRTIYLSRNNYGPTLKTTGIIAITYFNLSVPGDRPNSGCIQAEIYRAPEVILDAGLTYSADIWSLGVMDVDPLRDQEYNEPNHLAHITSLLGPPPEDVMARGRRSDLFYTSEPLSLSFKFENLIRNIHGDDKRMFIEFVSKMIKWRPEERSTEKELLEDP